MSRLIHTEGVRLLLVDDEAFSRQILTKMLRTIGITVKRDADGGKRIEIGRFGLAQGQGSQRMQVIEARNVADAVSILATNQVDGVITDFAMPGRTGLDLARAIRGRETKARRNLPIAIVAEEASSEMVTAAIALEVNALMVKPVAPGMLIHRLGRMFSGEVLGAPAPRPAAVVSAPARQPRVREADLLPVGVPAAADVAVEADPEPPPSEIEIDLLPMAAPAIDAAPAPEPEPEPASAPEPEPAAPSVPPRRFRLERLPENVRLARPIYGLDEEPVLRAGTVLTADHLAMLRDLTQRGVSIDEIWAFE